MLLETSDAKNKPVFHSYAKSKEAKVQSFLGKAHEIIKSTFYKSN